MLPGPGLSEFSRGRNFLFDKVFDDSGTSQDEEDLEDASRIELQNYLKEKRCVMTTDPQEHRKINRLKYPVLAKLVKRFHCTPPGSAPSERMFSTAKNVVGSKRLSLKPDNFECLLCLKYNFRSLKITNGEPPQLPPSVNSVINDDSDERSDVEILSESEDDGFRIIVS